MLKTKELLISQLDPRKWTNIPAGFRIYTLWEDPKTGASIALFQIPKGKGVPTRHVHASNQFMYCLAGEYEYLSTGLVLKPGSFYMNPKGHPHGPTIARKDSLLIEMYDGPHYFELPSYHSKKTVGRIAARGKKAAAGKPAKKAPAKKTAAVRKPAARKIAAKKPARRLPARGRQ
jgi:2,4'-dihydroxyacetophenone dioxygenase